MANLFDKIHPTRFKELGFTMVAPGCWRFLDLTDKDRPATVGQEYPTKAQLIANIEAYASFYGCDGADPHVLTTPGLRETTPPAPEPPSMTIQVTRYKDAIFIPLPPELWRKCGGQCSCDICKADGTGGYWDTLAVAKDAPKSKNANDFTYTVHHPGLHNPETRKRYAYTPEGA